MSKKPKKINPDEVDPSVYYYDEDYDDIKDEQDSERRDLEQKESRERKKGSKYISGLLESANERKRDKEVRKFKKYTKDREEAEAQGQLDGTEVILTSAYKRKLEEMKIIDTDKKRRLEEEKSRQLNYIQLSTPSGSKGVKDSGHRKTDDSVQPISGRSYETLSDSKPIAELPSLSTRPKTFKERKEYIRQILAKRTVGQVFEDALARYKQRKLESQEVG